MTLRHALVAVMLLATVPGTSGAAARVTARAPHHARAGSTHAGVAERGRPGAASRTLDDIHIEGEIPVPQVLFITARDQRRFMEFQHGRYLRTSRKLGEDTVLPSWVVVTGTRPAENKGGSR